MTTPITNGKAQLQIFLKKLHVADELSPYKELFTTVVLQQDHGAAATSCFRVYCSCWAILLWTSSISCANAMNSTAKVTNSTANGTKSIAKVTNSIAKTRNKYFRFKEENPSLLEED